MSVRFLRIVATVGALFAAAGTSPAAEPQDAPRIVSIGGAVTEILYALGLEDRVVAVDATSVWPERARKKPQVGYMRALSPEGVLSVNPTMVIAAEGAGPPETIEILKRSAIPFVTIPEKDSVSGVVEKITAVAKAVGEEEAGAKLADAVRADFAALAEIVKDIAPKRRAMFVLSMAQGSPVAAGGNSSAEAIFGLAGVENAVTGFAGFKTVSDEAVMAAAPEALIVMSEREGAKQRDLFSSPGLASTPAARDKRAVRMSGVYLLGFGPRAAHAARDLAAAVYPERNIPALPQRPWTVAQ